MIKYYSKLQNNGGLLSLSAFKPGCWVNCINPSDKELNFLVNKFELDEYLLQDALDPFEVPRLEREEGIIYFYTRYPAEKEADDDTLPILIAIGENFVLSLSEDDTGIFDKLLNINPFYVTSNKTLFFIKLMMEVVNAFNALLNQVNKDVRKLTMKPSKIKEKDIINLASYEETLNSFISDLIPTDNSLKQMLSGKYLKLYKKDKDLVEDILLSTEQLIETCKSNLKTIGNLRNVYSTIVTNRLNKVIKILTVITVLLTIPTILASLFGMNVNLPFQNHPMAFWIVIALILGSSLFTVILFIKKDWIS